MTAWEQPVHRISTWSCSDLRTTPAVFNMGRVPHHSVKPSWRTFELLPKSGRCDDKHAWRVTYDTAKPPGTCYDGR
jgi:hypothetical protein